MVRRRQWTNGLLFLREALSVDQLTPRARLLRVTLDRANRVCLPGYFRFAPKATHSRATAK